MDIKNTERRKEGRKEGRKGERKSILALTSATSSFSSWLES